VPKEVTKKQTEILAISMQQLNHHHDPDHAAAALTLQQQDEKKDHVRERYELLARIVEEHIHVDEIIQIAKTTTETTKITMPVPVTLTPYPPLPTTTLDRPCRIGVAHDEAFYFYYHDNLSLLQQQNNNTTQIIYFSPIHTKQLPPLLDAIYIGGGYPELHAEQL
jgi:cobyrinic acid a,c-diamide synthase